MSWLIALDGYLHEGRATLLAAWTHPARLDPRCTCREHFGSAVAPERYLPAAPGSSSTVLIAGLAAAIDISVPTAIAASPPYEHVPVSDAYQRTSCVITPVWARSTARSLTRSKHSHNRDATMTKPNELSGSDGQFHTIRSAPSRSRQLTRRGPPALRFPVRGRECHRWSLGKTLAEVQPTNCFTNSRLNKEAMGLARNSILSLIVAYS